MSLSNAIGAYADCIEYFTQAQDSRRGIRLCFATQGQAKYFHGRMNQARTLQRQESTRLYPEDDPRRGKSEFDKLQVKAPISDGKEWWVYIEPMNARVLAVEVIEDDTVHITPPPLQIEGPTNEQEQA